MAFIGTTNKDFDELLFDEQECLQTVEGERIKGDTLG